MSSVGIASDSFNFFRGGDGSFGLGVSVKVCVPSSSSELVDEAGASMAFPTRTVHVQGWPDGLQMTEG